MDVAGQVVRPNRIAVWVGLTWGIVGLFGVLIEAVVRLLPLAVAPLRGGMDWVGYVCYFGFVALNAYTEGYRGFQCAFSPRVAARALLLAREPTPLRLVLAPLFLMALVDATRRRLIANWLLVFGIVGLVLLVRMSPQPWRGIVDAGVVVGLGWGMISTVVWLVRALRLRSLAVDPETAAVRSEAPTTAVVQRNR